MVAINFTLESTYVESLELTKQKVTENGIELEVDRVYSKDNESGFCISFELMLCSVEGFMLKVIYVAKFSATQPLTKEFKSSAFPYVNAPAIGYPYLRAFVSTLLLNAGHAPAVLPTINFQAKYNKEQEAKKLVSE